MTFRVSREEAVAHVGEREWQKGSSYVRGLTGLSAQPDGERVVLRGHAHGQEKYAVSVTLAGGEIEAVDCSCPVGSGCKHCAALLARAVNDPGAFMALPALDEVLDGLDADGLRRLIRRMLEREPELHRLLLTAPRSSGGGDLRQRVEAAFALIDYDPEEDWEGEGPDLSDLEPLLEETQARLDRLEHLTPQAQADLLDACLAFLSGCGELDDEDYDLGLDGFVGPARTGVLRLLALGLPENESEVALDGLQESIGDFGWKRAEMEEHGQLALFAALPDEAQRLVMTFVRGLMDALKEPYRKQQLAGTLLALSSSTSLNPDEELRLAHATGDQASVIRVLLRHGRTQDAIQTLSASQPRLAPQQVEAEFRERELLPQLEAYAQANLKVFGARAWLYGRCRETGRETEAYALARDAVLGGTGDHPNYTSHFLARDLDWLGELRRISPDWPADREAYVRRQWKHPMLAQSLMRFLLAEGLLERATELVNRTPPGQSSSVGAELIGSLALRLPAEQAKPLLLRAVAEHVAGRGRAQYHEAATLMNRAAGVIGQEEVTSIARLLMQDYPKLPALKDELKKARLL